MFSKKASLLAMVTLFVGLLFSVTAVEAQAQELEQTTAISGTVVDSETEQPVSGIELKIEGTEQSAQTDEKGQFSFSGLAPGTYTIVATPEGYQEVSKEVELGAEGKEVTITLMPSGQ
ncbi:carboxypeptidase-like regulatory domain-containing protein [Halalkalibaculum sp. DA3122]|uniref:carboxypeptidase-like regulatory domain-containing protein n=1 Tax=unclassified Halalkalibaculum TaxID=2964617 RepID=UPI0037550090